MASALFSVLRAQGMLEQGMHFHVQHLVGLLGCEGGSNILEAGRCFVPKLSRLCLGHRPALINLALRCDNTLVNLLLVEFISLRCSERDEDNCKI